MRRRRRSTLKLALAIAAGALFTWVVAWGCALWMPLSPGEPVLSTGPDAEATALSAGLEPLDESMQWRVTSRVWTGPGIRVTEQLATPERTARPTFESFARFPWNDVSAGFPLPALEGKRSLMYVHADSAIFPPRWAQRPPPARPARMLQLIPRPLGFALNTFVYAALVVGAFELTALSRRRARVSRNRCPSCNYDRTGLHFLAACPECGELAP